jgi:hypothetical protein
MVIGASQTAGASVARGRTPSLAHDKGKAKSGHAKKQEFRREGEG